MSILCSMVGASFGTLTVVAQVLRSKKGIAAVGNAQISTAQSKFGGTSAIFNGSNHLKVEPIALGSGDFTIEFWLYNTTLSGYKTMFDQRTGSDAAPVMYFNGTTIYYNVSGSDRITGSSLSTSVWYHIAVSRSGTSTKMFVNGTQVGSTYTDTTTYISNGSTWIGSYYGGDSGIIGHIDEFRISNSARYTANFVAPTQPFVNDDNTVLLIHANGTNATTFFEDDNGSTTLRTAKTITAFGNAQLSTAQEKFGQSSVLFDGTGDYLQMDTFGPVAASGQDFTIEFWVYWTSLTGGQGLVSDRPPTTTGYGATNFYLEKNSSNTIFFGYSGGGDITGTSSVAANTWYHIAIVRSAGTTKFYLNGTTSGSTLSYTGVVGDGTLSIGAVVGQYMNGYMDEIRISKVARYTANFTAPTATFANDANTLLLIHADGADASVTVTDDNSGRSPNGLFRQNTAAISTAQSKFGGSSLSLNGTSSLNTPTEFAFGISDFTVEYWVRPTTLVGYDIHWDLRGANTSQISPIVYTNGATLYMDVGATTRITGSTLSTGVWYHIALTRASGSTKLFVNGTQVGSTYADTNNYLAATPLYIGMSQSGSGVDGFMDEFRISNIARYTANFTAPAAAFVNDANTLLLVHADGTDASTVFRDDNGEVPVAITTTSAVAFDGTNDYYSATGLTTTATDSKYITIAFTWFHNSGGNSRNQHFMTARLGTTNGENGWEVCIQSGRFRYSSYDNSGSNTDLVYGDYAGPTENAWNQIVAYIDHTSFANCKYFLNGVDRTSSLLNGSAVGAVNLANLNINWGSSNVSIRIGEQDPTAGYNSGFDDFLGSISQIYCHNAAGAPDISKFWQQGKPLDLGTNGTATGLAQPLIYHYGGTATFAANNGTGFNSYTLTANGNISTSTNNSIYQQLRTPKGVAAIGNAQVSTAQSKFGGASSLYDGTGDYLIVGNAVDNDMALTGTTWTVEYWARITSHTGSFNNTIGIWDSTTATGAVYYFTTNAYNGTQKMGFSYVYGTNNLSGDLNFGTALATGVWQHHAFVRNGNTLTAYLDGISQGTHDMTGRTIDITGYNNSSNTSLKMTIGAMNDATGAYNGYLDEVRISNTARYTAAFTPSTTPFQNDDNTVLLLHMDGTNASTVFFDDNGAKPYTP